MLGDFVPMIRFHEHEKRVLGVGFKVHKCVFGSLPTMMCNTCGTFPVQKP